MTRYERDTENGGHITVRYDASETKVWGNTSLTREELKEFITTLQTALLRRTRDGVEYTRHRMKERQQEVLIAAMLLRKHCTVEYLSGFLSHFFNAGNRIAIVLGKLWVLEVVESRCAFTGGYFELAKDWKKKLPEYGRRENSIESFKKEISS